MVLFSQSQLTRLFLHSFLHDNHRVDSDCNDDDDDYLQMAREPNHEVFQLEAHLMLEDVQVWLRDKTCRLKDDFLVYWV